MPKPFRAGFLLFPWVTQLDLTGPAQVFSQMSHSEVRLVWKSLDPVPTDAGFSIVPTDTLDDCPELDLICVPGGPGQERVMHDDTVLAWLAERGERSPYLVGVCSGSLLLGAAGLMRGYTMGAHWAYREHIALFGAKISADRVVVDRNRFTGGGVTAGIDIALTAVSRIRGRAEAEAIQLLLEYAPEPPFNSGRPETASPETILTVRAMLAAALASEARRD